MSVLGMGGRNEGGFELAAGQVDPSGQHFPEKAGEEPGVDWPWRSRNCDGAVVEEESEHAPHALEGVGDAGVSAGLRQAFGESHGEGFKLGRRAGLSRRIPERGQAGGHRQGISGERAGLINGSAGETWSMIVPRPHRRPPAGRRR